MFDWRTPPLRQNILATVPGAVALCLVLGGLATPAFAAKTVHVPCKETTEVTLTVSVHGLVAEVVNHNPSEAGISNTDTKTDGEIAPSASLLAPQAEAAIREAFEASESPINSSDAKLNNVVLTSPLAPPMAAESDAETKTPAEDDDTVEADSRMHTKLPGISDDDLSRYKKQMFRRDI